MSKAGLGSSSLPSSEEASSATPLQAPPTAPVLPSSRTLVDEETLAAAARKLVAAPVPSVAAAASAAARKIVEFKRKGEDTLRMSGLGYTIIRPGSLVDEPGGYKALVFDQVRSR